MRVRPAIPGALAALLLAAACSGSSPTAPGGGGTPPPPPPPGPLAISWDGRTIAWGEPAVLRASLDGATAPIEVEWVSLSDNYLGAPVVLGHGPEVSTHALRPGTSRVEARLSTPAGMVRDTVLVTVQYRESWNVQREALVPFPDGTVGDVWVAGNVAIVARRGATGASFVALDGLVTEIGRFTAPGLFTQDVKAAGGRAYLTNEGDYLDGTVAILDIADPTAPALLGNVPIGMGPRAHNVYIQGDVLAIASPPTGDVHLVDVSDPAAPRALGTVSTTMSGAHDMHLAGNLLFGAFLGGELTVADISNPAAPAVLSRIHYSGAFTHSAWLAADGRHLYVLDEVVNAPVRIYDVSSPANPVLAGIYQPRLGTIPHNLQVRDGRFAYIANYKNGVEVLDVSDPARPRLVGFYDTHPGAASDGGVAQSLSMAHEKGGALFEGNWGVHWTADGRILASDMNRGLFVLRYTGS